MKRPTLKSLEAVVGTLSVPSKMPCFGYSTPAAHCIVGGRISKDPNSTCWSCYAKKGRYTFARTIAAMEKRFQSLKDIKLWEETMTELIGRKEKSQWFRWHDSGDLQSVEHLNAIVNIAKNLPHIEFWIPTREYRVVRDWRKENGKFPKNLIVRLSAHFRGKAPKARYLEDLPTSTVGWEESPHECPAQHQGNQCGDCRACWDPKVTNVDYPLH